MTASHIPSVPIVQSSHASTRSHFVDPRTYDERFPGRLAILLGCHAVTCCISLALVARTISRSTSSIDPLTFPAPCRGRRLFRRGLLSRFASASASAISSASISSPWSRLSLAERYIGYEYDHRLGGFPRPLRGSHSHALPSSYAPIKQGFSTVRGVDSFLMLILAVSAPHGRRPPRLSA